MSDERSLEDEVTALRQDMRGLISQHQSAMQRITDLEEQVAEYEDERERLVFRVGKLESILPDESDPYEDLSREERVMRVQNYVMERAWSSNGRFQIDYNDVLALFNDKPSAGYCYKLMKLAGQEDGFSYDGGDGKRLRVNLDRVNGDGVLSRVNKVQIAVQSAESDGGRRIGRRTCD